MCVQQSNIRGVEFYRVDQKIVNFIIWIALVCLWNFGVPTAAPVYDVIVAVILSFIAKIKFSNYKIN